MYSGAGPGESARRPALVPRRLAVGGRGRRGRRGLWGRGVALGRSGRASGRGGPVHRSSTAGTWGGGRPGLQRVPVLPQRSSRRPPAHRCGAQHAGPGAGSWTGREPTRGDAVPRRAAALPIQVLIALRFPSGAGGRRGTPSHQRARLSGKVPENLKTRTHFPTPLLELSGGRFTRGLEKTSVGRLFRLLPPGTWLHFPAAPPLARVQPAPLCPPGCTWRPRGLPAAHLT